jgi:hypothetical protein
VLKWRLNKCNLLIRKQCKINRDLKEIRLREWTGYICLTTGESGGLVIFERHIRSRLRPYVTLRCYSSDVQVSSRTDSGSVPGNLMWVAWRTERHRSRFCVSLSSPSYLAFRQQPMITYHRLMMHVITFSRKHVITFSVFSRGLHLFLGTGLAIE